MNPCWNCEQSRPEDTRFCSTCGYPLRPEPYEVTGFLRGIEYLEREMRRWEWLDDARRASLAEHYAERRARLKPSQMRPPGPAPEPAPQPSQAVAEPTETLVDTFTGFLEERNIRWFQILGGLLLLAGFIGFLRMQWGAIGAFVISAILVGAPILVFHGAFRLRQTLPISSRMLSITGGLLTPIALLALHRYLPQISWQDWSAISFAISAGVLLFLSVRLEEIACLYLGSLSLALAAACAQASPSVAFGGCMLAAAFGYLAAARSGRAPAPFAPHLRALSQILATVGLLGTLPMLGGREIAGPLVFFCGAAFFATFSYLLHDVRALYGSAVAAIGLAAFLAASLSLPQIALLFLALGAVYLTLARTLGDPADEIADASVRLGVGLVAVALVALLGIDLLRAIVDGFQALPRETLAWTVLVALASALYYTIAAVVFGSPRLIYGATAGLAYAEIVAVAWLQHPGAQWIPLTMALFPLAVLLLRPVVPARWLAPALEAATWIALVPGPLALLQWAADVPEAARLTPWTALILALFYLLSAAWTRRPSLLYFGALWTFVGYVSFLKPGLAAYGLALLPLAATLAVAALAVDRRHGRAFALPLARSAWVLAVVVLAAQYVLWMSAERGGVPQTLLLAALGFAALARPFAAWTLGAGPADRALATVAALAVPPAAWSGLSLAGFGNHTLVLVAALVSALLAASLVPSERWSPALRAAALCWSALLLMASPTPDAEIAMRLFPALLWLADGVLRRHGGTAATSVLLAAGGLLWTDLSAPLATPAPRAALLIALALGYARLRGLHEAFCVPSWLAAGYAWACLLRLSGLPDAHFALGFVPFNILVAMAYARTRLAVLEAAANVTAVLVLSAAGGHEDPTIFPTLALGYAAGYGAVARQRDHAVYEATAWLLPMLGWIYWCQRAMPVPMHAVLEWVTAPPGAWLLLWSAAGRHARRVSLERAGGALLVVPSLLLSTGPENGTHAMLAGLFGLGLLLAGAGFARANLLVAGSAALLLEALIQAHHVLVRHMPVYLTAVGVLIIGLGILFERRRRDLLALGQRLARRMST